MEVKKLFLIAFISLFSLSLHAQQAKDSTKPKPQTFTVSADLQTFQVLMDALDKSEAPHNQVKALEAWIAGEINKQLKPKK
jgi:hypothetical protein